MVTWTLRKNGTGHHERDRDHCHEHSRHDHDDDGHHKARTMRDNEEEDGVDNAAPNMSGTTTMDSTQPISVNPNERETT